MQGARAVRAQLGVPASAAARGTLAARALQARAKAHATRPSPPQPADRRPLTRSSPVRGGATEGVDGGATTRRRRAAR
eukprot:3081473-Pleurochrysis_carterae.AAC.1